METIQERKDKLLKFENLDLLIEGNNTFLRIWISKQSNLIGLRLEKISQYSSPLNKESILYLKEENRNKIKELLKFNFITNFENLDEILNITKNLKKINKIYNW